MVGHQCQVERSQVESDINVGEGPAPSLHAFLGMPARKDGHPLKNQSPETVENNLGIETDTGTVNEIHVLIRKEVALDRVVKAPTHRPQSEENCPNAAGAGQQAGGHLPYLTAESQLQTPPSGHHIHHSDTGPATSDGVRFKQNRVSHANILKRFTVERASDLVNR
jgi:hypothetical protein